ncbi:MAG: hypothetical protein LH472_16305, partial [Pyrinomonadaceae bacterium]|nr:hypothetical protein [Pyrinomonadaceae bacterium]
RIKMKKSLIVAFAFIIFTTPVHLFAQIKNCSCRTALKDDVPLGGNQIIIEKAGTVNQIRGITTFWINNKTFEDVVIEVFAISKKEDKNLTDYAWKVVENKKRKVACIRGKNGKFCFKDLLKGTYVLRIGTRTRKIEYFNYVHVIVKLNPKSGKNKEIKVGLTVAD